MAGISAHWEFNWTEAEKRFRLAIAIQPSNYSAHAWFGGVLAMLGRFEEAEEQCGIAIKLNPLFPSGHARLGFLNYLRGNHDQAIALLQHSMQLAKDYPEAQFGLGMVYLRQGNYPAAIEMLCRGLDERPTAIHIGMLAAAYYRAGRPDESKRLVDRLEGMAANGYVTPMAKVAACIGMEDYEGAIAALAASIDDRAIFANTLNVDPFLDPLRRDARFHRLVASMNLQPRLPA